MDVDEERPRKIVYIHHGQGFGGASRSLLSIIEPLDRSTFQPKVLCLYESEAAHLFKNNGVDVRILASWRHFSHSEVRWIKWYRPDRLLLAFNSWFMTAFFYGKKIFRDEKPDIWYWSKQLAGRFSHNTNPLRRK